MQISHSLSVCRARDASLTFAGQARWAGSKLNLSRVLEYRVRERMCCNRLNLRRIETREASSCFVTYRACRAITPEARCVLTGGGECCPVAKSTAPAARSEVGPRHPQNPHYSIPCWQHGMLINHLAVSVLNSAWPFQIQIWCPAHGLSKLQI